MDSVARGSLINLATRLLAVSLGLAITLVTARLGPEQQGSFALFTAVEAVLLALGSGFGVAIARRISHHRERPGGLATASVFACVAGGVLVGTGLLVVASAAGGAYQILALLALAAPLRAGERARVCHDDRPQPGARPPAPARPRAARPRGRG
jgi:O-antigen/teichoic acid export membrane protein